jgi:hypothetical protein
MRYKSRNVGRCWFPRGLGNFLRTSSTSGAEPASIGWLRLGTAIANKQWPSLARRGREKMPIQAGWPMLVPMKPG